jgi:hypothetical protein
MKPADRTARMKLACDEALQALVGPNVAELWWNSANRAFDGRTPKQQFEFDPNSVYQYLIEHCMGDYY